MISTGLLSVCSSSQISHYTGLLTTDPSQEEDSGNNMNAERRRANLEKKIQAVEGELDRQQKARQGVESLAKVYQEQPDFTDEKGANDVTRQLTEVRLPTNCSFTLSIPSPPSSPLPPPPPQADAMLNMLKATHYKLLCAHAEFSQGPRPTSHFSEYIHTTKDKQVRLEC